MKKKNRGLQTNWDSSSVGRAPGSHSGGQGFNSLLFHIFSPLFHMQNLQPWNSFDFNELFQYIRIYFLIAINNYLYVYLTKLYFYHKAIKKIATITVKKCLFVIQVQAKWGNIMLHQNRHDLSIFHSAYALKSSSSPSFFSLILVRYNSKDPSEQTMKE